jgi:hypothetical protein
MKLSPKSALKPTQLFETLHVSSLAGRKVSKSGMEVEAISFPKKSNPLMTMYEYPWEPRETQRRDPTPGVYSLPGHG